MNIPRDFIDLLLAKIDIVDLINSQIPLRKKSGSNYFARCPFHNEKSASFSVSQPKQFFYCFGCGAHGNAIDFVMQHDRLNFKEAIEMLARTAGMEIPDSGAFTKKSDSLTALYELNSKAADFYHDQLRKSPKAINYLKKRSLSGVTAKAFHLGYAPDGFRHLLDHFTKSGVERKKLHDIGLIIKKTEDNYYDRFRERIMFPIHDYRGRIIGFGGRILENGEPKYLNSPETPLFQKGHELYGLHQALKMNRKLERVLIVEGYMDVIALFQHGITYAVATMGTATTPHHLQRLFRYTNEIVFCFDGDEAGKTAAWRALQVIFPLMQDHLEIRFLFLPDGEDPDSLINKEDKAHFERRILSATSVATFFFQTLSQQTHLETMEGRARFASLALQHIKQLPDGLFQGILLAELAKRARVDSEDLKKQLGQRDEAKAPSPPKNEVLQEAPKTKLSPPLRLALALLVQHPQLIALIKEPLPKNPLPGYQFLLELIEQIKAKPNLTTGALLEYWRGQKEETILAKLAKFEHMVPEAGVQNEFMGAIRQMTQFSYDDEINRLLAKAAQSGLSDTEKVELSTWINKKKTLFCD